MYKKSNRKYLWDHRESLRYDRESSPGDYECRRDDRREVHEMTDGRSLECRVGLRDDRGVYRVCAESTSDRVSLFGR